MQYMETVTTLHQLPPSHKIPPCLTCRQRLSRDLHLEREEEEVVDCHPQPAGDPHEPALLALSSCADHIARSSAFCDGSDCPTLSLAVQQFKLLGGRRVPLGILLPPPVKEILRRHSVTRRKASSPPPQVVGTKAPPGPLAPGEDSHQPVPAKPPY